VNANDVRSDGLPGGPGRDASTSDPIVEPPKPSWRGRLHQIAFFAAIPAGIALIALAQGTSARVAASIYAASLVGMYGTSATYHRLARSVRSRRWLKRLDHSMIFVLIAGTSTPLALIAMHKPWSIVTLVVVWTGAGAGIAMKMLRIDGFKVLSGTLYIALGWVVILMSPQLLHELSPTSIALVLAGGLLYMVGAVVLLRRKPDPVPSTFGYHEIWHSMVVGASACHYAFVLLIVLAARPSIG
jgi:hemolysin III